MAAARHFNTAERDRAAEWPAQLRIVDRIDVSYQD